MIKDLCEDEMDPVNNPMFPAFILYVSGFVLFGIILIVWYRIRYKNIKKVLEIQSKKRNGIIEKTPSFAHDPLGLHIKFSIKKYTIMISVYPLLIGGYAYATKLYMIGMPKCKKTTVNISSLKESFEIKGEESLINKIFTPELQSKLLEFLPGKPSLIIENDEMEIYLKYKILKTEEEYDLLIELALEIAEKIEKQ